MPTGKVSGFAMAVDWVMESPRRRMRGTVMTLPPTPRQAAMVPMLRPSAAVVLEDGAATSLVCIAVFCTKPGRSTQSAMVITM